MKQNRRQGFSLIELVIVVVIIAIIGAIAIPRMSRGSAGAGDSALTQDLALVRSALELYAAEHGGQYPTVANLTAAPPNSATQLTGFTDANGNTSPTKGGAFVFGPYLKTIPSAPVGKNAKGSNVIANAPTATPGTGWVYTVDGNGLPSFTLNTDGTELDAKGAAYSSY